MGSAVFVAVRSTLVNIISPLFSAEFSFESVTLFAIHPEILNRLILECPDCSSTFEQLARIGLVVCLKRVFRATSILMWTIPVHAPIAVVSQHLRPLDVAPMSRIDIGQILNAEPFHSPKSFLKCLIEYSVNSDW